MIRCWRDGARRPRCTSTSAELGFITDCRQEPHCSATIQAHSGEGRQRFSAEKRCTTRLNERTSAIKNSAARRLSREAPDCASAALEPGCHSHVLLRAILFHVAGLYGGFYLCFGLGSAPSPPALSSHIRTEAVPCRILPPRSERAVDARALRCPRSGGGCGEGRMMRSLRFAFHHVPGGIVLRLVRRSTVLANDLLKSCFDTEGCEQGGDRRS